MPLDRPREARLNDVDLVKIEIPVWSVIELVTVCGKPVAKVGQLRLYFFLFFPFLQLTTYNDVLGEGRLGLGDESARRGMSHLTRRRSCNVTWCDDVHVIAME
jgi:hypothetical protein